MMICNLMLFFVGWHAFFERENRRIHLGHSPTKIIWLMEHCLGNTWILLILTQKPLRLWQIFVCWLQQGFDKLSLKWNIQHLPVVCPCWPWCRTLTSRWPHGRGRPDAFSLLSTSSAALRLASPHPEPSFQRPCHKISAIPPWKHESVKTEHNCPLYNECQTQSANRGQFFYFAT